MATQFVAHALLLQKDQIYHYAPYAPICMAPQDIAHKVQVVVDSDSHQRNWQVARDAVRPKCRFAETVPTDGLARTQRRTREEDRSCEPLEERSVARCQSQFLSLSLVASSGLLEHVVHGLKTAKEF